MYTMTEEPLGPALHQGSVMKEFTLHYTAPLLREAACCFAIRLTLGGLRWLSGAALFLCLLFTSYGLADGRLFLGIVYFTVILGLIITLMAGVMLIKYRLIGRRADMPVPRATFAYTALGFTFHSELGIVSRYWLEVRDVWRFKKFWIVRYAPLEYLALPVADMDERSLTYIIGKTATATAMAR